MTTKQKAPTVTLKNVKVSKFASEETPCYEATAYVDGKPFCRVSNHGQGGSDDCWPLQGKRGEIWADVRALNERIKATMEPEATDWTDPRTGEPFLHHHTFESLCHEALGRWEDDQHVKRTLKKVVAVHKDGRCYTYKLAPTAENVQRVASLDVVEKVLNTLPLEEARRYLVTGGE